MIEQKVIDLIAEQLGMEDKSNITAETTFDGLGMDSLDKAEITMKLEDLYNITIDDNIRFRTIGDAVNYIQTNKEYVLNGSADWLKKKINPRFSLF